MSKVLFIPLNTNHVLIFNNIIKSLHCEYEVLCHDNISEAEQYHTANILKNIGMPYRHFSKSIQRSSADGLLMRLSHFFKMKNVIKKTIKRIKPNVIVVAIDNDPIAQLCIEAAKTYGIKTVLIQEALIRPNEYANHKKYYSDYFYELLRLFGIYLTYIQYGDGNCDRVLVSGKRAKEILLKTGISENKIEIVGMPKYDALYEKMQDYRPSDNKKKVYLFAASTTLIKDEQNIRFLKIIIESANKLGVYLIVKLHPRTPHEPSDIYKIMNFPDTFSFEIIKKGDDTFEILKRSDALITVSSTVILEALMLDKECVVADYLAGDSCLEYGQYDAIHSIGNEEEIHNAMKNSLLFKKSSQNKKRLLEDELCKLDGQAGKRAAKFIEGMISQLPR